MKDRGSFLDPYKSTDSNDKQIKNLRQSFETVLVDLATGFSPADKGLDKDAKDRYNIGEPAPKPGSGDGTGGNMSQQLTPQERVKQMLAEREAKAKGGGGQSSGNTSSNSANGQQSQSNSPKDHAPCKPLIDALDERVTKVEWDVVRLDDIVTDAVGIVDNFIEDTTVQIVARLADEARTHIDAVVKDELDMVRKLLPLKIIINDKAYTTKGLTHENMPWLLETMALRLSPLMVGTPGTGKSHAAKQAAEVLGLTFDSMSVGLQTSKADILGYMHAGGDYVPSLFRHAYENGGVFLMDEIDAGNPNVLVIINAALSNKVSGFPDGMVERHKDFIFVGAANTYGLGQDRQYVGRNQLDAATLDRFAYVDWPIDEALEYALIYPYENGPRWIKVVRAIRHYIYSNKIQMVVSPRMSIKGAALLDAGQAFDRVVQSVVTPLTPKDELERVQTIIKSNWR